MENENISMNEVPPTEPTQVKDEQPCNPKKCRCSLQLILSIVALAGVIALFILYSACGSCCGTGKASKSKSGGLRMVYVNIDTIMAKYDMVKVIRDSLTAKQKKATDSLEKLQTAFQYEVTAYQNKVKANTFATIEAATKVENGLKEEQDNLLALKDELSNQLSDENIKMSTQLQDNITNFLKRYNTKYNYDYIFSYSKSGEILFANADLDITKAVIEELNKEYKSKKK